MRFVAPPQEPAAGVVAIVGGKNASVGEMPRTLTAQEDDVVTGFDAYLRNSGLHEAIEEAMRELDKGDHLGEERVRRAIGRGSLPNELHTAIVEGYDRLSERRAGDRRRGAPAGEGRGLPRGVLRRAAGDAAVPRGQDVLDAARRSNTSLFTGGAIHYRASRSTAAGASDSSAVFVALSSRLRRCRRWSGPALSSGCNTLRRDTGVAVH